MPALPSNLSTTSPKDTRFLESRQLISNALQRASALLLSKRQSGFVLAIPTQYAGINSGPSPGAVVGIVLGSVAGFLLLIWLLWVLSSGSGFILGTALREEDVTITRRRTERSQSRATRRSHRTEMTSRSPPRRKRDRIIRQERIVRDRSAPPPPREVSRIRETILVDEVSRPPPMERRVAGDDIVEVIEEHSSIEVPAPRRKSRRSSGYSRRDEFL